MEGQAPDARLKLGALLGSLRDAVNRREHLLLESISDPRIARRIPHERFVGLALCFERKDDRTAGHLSLARRYVRGPLPRGRSGSDPPGYRRGASGPPRPMSARPLPATRRPRSPGAAARGRAVRSRGASSPRRGALRPGGSSLAA
ncbi:uncharacterized protein SOCE26_044690 [Sorangium cellulosum]|uniref:Uncharacterized protein n=1 Tax=Sorangium cellulosum TaxID=56 RepID=A0A2L0EUT3_SORCE|nr:uncharacterized protein SOCE26_044690 [Sorangium cellulosum]